MIRYEELVKGKNDDDDDDDDLLTLSELPASMV